MSDALSKLLAEFRLNANNQRDKGTSFENLAIVYLANDRTRQSYLDKVWTYSDWAMEHGIKGNDAGIDLVASIRDSDGFCAVQCKFYAEGHRISKSDLDSFFTASGKSHFTQRLFIDTTDTSWSSNAEDALIGQQIECTRIGLRDLRESSVDWSSYLNTGKVAHKETKTLRPDQREALAAVETGLVTADRGKLVMACGTGKTFTSLRIAEQLVGVNGSVLFLVPSLALMSQTITEWSNDANTPMRAFAACSDTKVGKRKSKNSEADSLSDDINDLAYPATTDAGKLVERFGSKVADRMTVVFSTYQSIDVISKAQTLGMPEFDLIICDEAHRTTGAKFGDEDVSKFIKVHDQNLVAGKKRLYMTATPRIYGDAVKSKAKENSIELCSMDKVEQYGETFYTHGFSQAVQNGLLTDYKVIVLAVDEDKVARGVQARLTDEESKLTLDDATKMIGCYKALIKKDLEKDLLIDPQPMRRALTFCKSIEASKMVKQEFAKVVAEYQEQFGRDDETYANCEVDHVDGTFNAKSRNQLLDWLKEDTEENTCRVLSNARCLSEGVDVPALDAIMFLHPRKSQIDVVQSVGRVMRRAEGKKMGYVILPIGIPAGMTPEEALNDNEKYKVVWQILNALRAHDDRFDATINRIDLGEDVSDHIEIIAEVADLPNKVMAKSTSGDWGDSTATDSDADQDTSQAGQSRSGKTQGDLFIDEFTSAIMAKIVKKCGTRDYWEDWATDIAKIAQTHITRIRTTVEGDGVERAAFLDFLNELRDDLNESISEEDAVEMLAQHIITKPVFEALFNNSDFVAKNPVSKAMQSVLSVLEQQNLQAEATESLTKFYNSVKVRAAGIETAKGRQALVVQLYDKFFSKAFKSTAERLGIVYTPVEVVDFIIHSVNDVLQDQFGQTLGSEGVHIIDPFTGTGTFITRLLQSGLIKPEQLKHKYTHEIHANELVLLAYYIAAINIEAVYHELAAEPDYQPFEGICLTDTFQLHEESKLLDGILANNSSRRNKQRDLDIRVIMGNPPYSAGQKSANDNAANLKYEHLDGRIEQTYAKHSSATNKNALYDSYIRAIRWGSDQLAKGSGTGVLAFVTNAGWIDGSATDGLRKCLVEEFANLYIFHLRGNQRTSGELSRREGGKIFGSGSRTPVAIFVLVKDPTADQQGQIHFHDIGDYLSQKNKLKLVSDFGSLKGLGKSKGWQLIKPDQDNDWLDQRDTSFDKFIGLGDKKDKVGDYIFMNFSRGIETGRDVWNYSSSNTEFQKNIKSLINCYNLESTRWSESGMQETFSKFAIKDTARISWTSSLYSHAEKNIKIDFHMGFAAKSIYRPFQYQWLFYHPHLIHRVGQMPRIFPNATLENKTIAVSGNGSRNGMSVFMTNVLPDLNMLEAGAQCFPLHLYEKQEQLTVDGFEDVGEYRKRDGISDAGLAHFKAAYASEDISKEDLFYYIYGLLHSPDYRTRYANNLSKQLPRIPAVKTASDFWDFSKAGRALGHLHVNYETVEPYAVDIKEGDPNFADIDDPKTFYRVEKMKFGGKRPNQDKTTVVYNSNITMTGIPLEAYDYIVNGKSALDWVMERQCVKTDKDSGIVNDSNAYANETVGNPAYPLELFQRVITVSLKTMDIVNSLPALDID